MRTRIALLFPILCAGLAQEPAVVIRSSTRLVEMTVVVQDEKGRPVTDLTKDDFTLTDEGKRQTISVFESHSGPQVKTAGALSAGYFSNRLEYNGGAPSSATVLLIDLINPEPIAHPAGPGAAFWGRAQPHLAKFLQQADPRLRMAIYVLSRNRLRVVHDFTTDASILARELTRAENGAIQGISGEMQSFITSLGDAAGAAAATMGHGNGFDLAAFLLRWSVEAERAYYRPMDGLETAEAFEIIAQRLSGIPGRKNLVWLSTGFKQTNDVSRITRSGESEIGRVNAAFDHAVRSLSNASVAVYPVDARGFFSRTDALVDIEPPRSSRRQVVRFEVGPTPQSISMKELATRTGGRLFQGEEIDEAMPAIFSHARSFYTLGYYPENDGLDGKFRQVRVRVARNNVRVSHRSGYYATPSSEAVEGRRDAELASAVWSPVDATAIGFSASLERDPRQPADARTLSLVVDGGGLLFDRRGDRMACRLDLLIVQKDTAGKQVESSLDTFESIAPADKVAAVLEKGIPYRKQFRLSPEAAILRVVLRNRAGALGSLSIPLR